MVEANIINIFNAKTRAFNEAVNAQDVETISVIGGEIVNLALEECSKSNVNTALKEKYGKQASAVLSYLVRYAKQKSFATVATDSNNNDGDNDPYYSPKQWFSAEVPDLNFTNIAGLQEVKDAFMVDVVAPLRPEFQEVYHKFRGDQIGTNILLYGPPGGGKTFTVKCLAGALNSKIAVVQTSEVLASVVGVAEKNIRDIFAQAAELDRCIIFFDEIDSLCADRGSEDSRHTKSILTTMLTCIDGFLKTTKKHQLRIIIAATNRPWALDTALKRGGRFETQIYVPLPDAPAREKLISLGLEKLPHDNDVTVEELVKRLDGFSGADINAIIKRIANEPLRREVINILRNGREKGEKITMRDCEKVINSYINVVTPEMLLRFKAYELGIPYAELKKNKNQGE